jgi:hypothetical protein
MTRDTLFRCRETPHSDVLNQDTAGTTVRHVEPNVVGLSRVVEGRKALGSARAWGQVPVVPTAVIVKAVVPALATESRSPE